MCDCSICVQPGIEKMLTGIFADPEMDVTANSLLEDVQGFLSNLEQQDEQFQEMVEKVTREGPEEEAAQLKEYSQARAAALRNLIALRDIIKDMQ